MAILKLVLTFALLIAVVCYSTYDLYKVAMEDEAN
jgi:hypothetical protein